MNKLQKADRYASVVQQDQLGEIDRLVSALQDRTRRRILLDFYMNQSEWTVDEVAASVGIHRTVAHGHLERLVALGYLSAGQRRGKFGKPAKLYRLAGQQIDVTYPIRRFARLAGLLARALQNRGEDGIAAAREVGRSFGASLINRRAASTGAAVRLLAPLGAEYVVTHREVVARNCIFREACAESMEIVCELHGGLLEGAFQQAGLKVRIEAFRDYPEHGCAYRVINA